MSSILLQTTIVPTPDDWSIARFSRLRALLEGLRDARERGVGAARRSERPRHRQRD